MSDLISREALKKKFERLVDETIPYGGVAVNDMRELIDNAPTVPLPDFKEGYKQAIIDGKTNFFRLKGKWVSKPNDEFCYCSECNNPEFGCLNFCRYCGADMRSDTK